MGKRKDGGDTRTEVLLEDTNSKLDALVEVVRDMRDYMQAHLATKEELGEVKADIKIVKAAVTDLSHQVNDHENRLNVVEARVL